MFKEKRKHRRFKTLNLADVTYKSASDVSVEGKDRGVVVDISMDGLVYASTRMFSLGDYVVFNFPPGDLRVSGTVTRVEQDDSHYLHGVEFKWISYLNKIRLSNMMQKLYRRLMAVRGEIPDKKLNE